MQPPTPPPPPRFKISVQDAQTFEQLLDNERGQKLDVHDSYSDADVSQRRKTSLAGRH